jgi:beta-glucanase (GH16 family)
VNPFGFKNWSLTIFANKTPQSLLSKTKNQKYTSGIITSRDSFNFTHWYAEARVKIPAWQWLWPAFWLLNTKYEGMKPEIDIMENLWHETNKVHQTYHYYDSTGKLISNESHVQGSIDYSEGYHTFAVQWEPWLIQYYIDGKKTKKIEWPGVASQDMYVLANLAVWWNWPKSPDATTNFPAQFAIDYIRVYEKK